MGTIFLSASIPVRERGKYHETADPFLIQCAVRELVIATIRRHKIVWGGHPAITPMIWSICEDLGVNYSDSVILYQSRFFEGRYPEENQRFNNVVFTDSISDDINASLKLMREQMLSREDLIGAVFIGGMEGVGAEYKIFRRFNPNAFVLPVAAPGGAALELARDSGEFTEIELENIDFATLYSLYLSTE